jgi:hypothetical protein
MRFLLQGFDVDVILGNDFRHSSHHAALVFHCQSQVPADWARLLANFQIAGINVVSCSRLHSTP